MARVARAVPRARPARSLTVCFRWLNDLALEAARQHAAHRSELSFDAIAETLLQSDSSVLHPGTSIYRAPAGAPSPGKYVVVSVFSPRAKLED